MYTMAAVSTHIDLPVVRGDRVVLPLDICLLSVDDHVATVQQLHHDTHGSVRQVQSILFYNVWYKCVCPCELLQVLRKT